MQNVGAISIIYEEQKKSSIEMIKSFRKNNPDSSIVIYCDGVVLNIDQVCKEYNCKCVIFPEKIGYPASKDLNIPLEYLHRFLQCSNFIKEEFYINLEPDCMVTGNLKLNDNCDSFIISSYPLQWSFQFCGDVVRRNKVMYELFDLYKLFFKSEYFESNVFDKIIGGGGMIYNKKFFIKILNEWELFKQRCLFVKFIFDKYEISDDYKNICHDLWYFDYMLSLQIPFYIEKKLDVEKENETVKNYIIHPYKNFYI